MRHRIFFISLHPAFVSSHCDLDSLTGTAATTDGRPQAAYGERDAGPDQKAGAQRRDGGDGFSGNAARFAGMREADPGSQPAPRIVRADGFPFYETSAAALEG